MQKTGHRRKMIKPLQYKEFGENRRRRSYLTGENESIILHSISYQSNEGVMFSAQTTESRRKSRKTVSRLSDFLNLISE